MREMLGKSMVPHTMLGKNALTFQRGEKNSSNIYNQKTKWSSCLGKGPRNVWWVLSTIAIDILIPWLIFYQLKVMLPHKPQLAKPEQNCLCQKNWLTLDLTDLATWCPEIHAIPQIKRKPNFLWKLMQGLGHISVATNRCFNFKEKKNLLSFE